MILDWQTGLNITIALRTGAVERHLAPETSANPKMKTRIFVVLGIALSSCVAADKMTNVTIRAQCDSCEFSVVRGNSVARFVLSGNEVNFPIMASSGAKDEILIFLNCESRKVLIARVIGPKTIRLQEIATCGDERSTDSNGADESR